MSTMSARGLPREPFCQLFRNLDEVTVTSLRKAARCRQLLPGEIFCRQGETVASLYLLKAGLAKASGTTASGNEVLLDWIYPGDAFGMEALLSSPMNHVWSIRANEASEALEWDKATIGHFAACCPHLYDNILGIILRGDHQLQERFTGLATERVEPRLARLTLHLSRSSTDHGSGELHISDEELAQMAGTNLFTVNRVLNHWRRLGHVEKSRRRLIVLHIDRLSAIAEGSASGP